jgi:hypothetical protein
MIHTTMPGSTDDDLNRGIRFHHATDHAFHGSKAFKRLNDAATHELLALGVRRGTRRAVAHIGTEFFIDAELASAEPLRADPYLAALRAAPQLTPHVRWSADARRDAFLDLCSKLAGRGLSAFDASTERMVLRIRWALAGRPRLEVWDTDLPHLTRWVARQPGRVAREVPAILDEVAELLDLHLPTQKSRGKPTSDQSPR